jgi:hypothetical protein
MALPACLCLPIRPPPTAHRPPLAQRGLWARQVLGAPNALRQALRSCAGRIFTTGSCSWSWLSFAAMASHDNRFAEMARLFKRGSQGLAERGELAEAGDQGLAVIGVREDLHR